MPRAPTTSDVFNAIAEPRRREIIGLLSGGATRSVGELVEAMKLAQPAVSKHLSVLRAVGIVSAQKVRKSRLYTLNPSELKPVHDWVRPFERFWSHQLDQIQERAERKAECARKN
jgi:DNA-binding transcriptional ArsR family regulator